MVCPDDEQVRERLEALYRRSPSVSVLEKFLEFFGQIGTAMLTELTRDRKALQISKFYDIDGKVLWHVFDPVSRDRSTFRSEVEFRKWIDQRYAAE